LTGSSPRGLGGPREVLRAWAWAGAAILAFSSCTRGAEAPSRTSRVLGEAVPSDVEGVLVALCEGFGPTPAGAEPVAHAVAVAGGLGWDVRALLTARAPRSAMRAAEYGVEGHPDAELTVFHFGAGQGGSVEDNLDRWVGQVTQPDGRPSRDVARIETLDAHGLRITTLDVRGTLGAAMPGMPAAGPPREGARVLGAIAEGPRGPVFFKLVGSEAALEAAEGSFHHLIESLHAAD
jgi:hypothetical protein